MVSSYVLTLVIKVAHWHWASKSLAFAKHFVNYVMEGCFDRMGRVAFGGVRFWYVQGPAPSF